MPKHFKDAKYYNLVNTKLLDPYIVNKYTEEILIKGHLRVLHLIGFIDDDRPIRLDANRFIVGNSWETNRRLYNLTFYLEWLYDNFNLNREEFDTLFKVLRNNNYKVGDILINAFINAENTYFINNVVIPSSRKIAINKIKRNAIYNNGLGLKLAIKAFKEDFN